MDTLEEPKELEHLRDHMLIFMKTREIYENFYPRNLDAPFIYINHAAKNHFFLVDPSILDFP